MVDSVRDSIIVDADFGTVFDIIADFERYPEWQPEVREVELLKTDEEGWGTRVRFAVDVKITTVRYTLDYEYTDDSMRWHLVEGDGLARNEGAYLLTALGHGTTRLAYELDLEPTFKVPGFLRRQIASRIADTALRGVKRRAEADA